MQHNTFPAPLGCTLRFFPGRSGGGCREELQPASQPGFHPFERSNPSCCLSLLIAQTGSLAIWLALPCAPPAWTDPHSARGNEIDFEGSAVGPRVLRQALAIPPLVSIRVFYNY